MTDFYTPDRCPHGYEINACVQCAKDARDKGIDDSFRASDDDWKEEAAGVLSSILHSSEFYTSDDVIEGVGHEPHELRAIGHVMRSAALADQAEDTGLRVPSRRSSRHRGDTRVWYSRICGVPKEGAWNRLREFARERGATGMIVQ